LKIFLLFRRAFSAISLRARICCTVLLSFDTIQYNIRLIQA